MQCPDLSKWNYIPKAGTLRGQDRLDNHEFKPAALNSIERYTQMGFTNAHNEGVVVVKD